MTTGFFKIAGFEEMQHYKHRNPPWIKLYNELLDDYRFAGLSEPARLQFILLCMLASRMENKMPCDNKFLRNRLNVQTDVRLDELQAAGFIELDEHASNMLATCKQDASNMLYQRESRVEQRRGRAESEEHATNLNSNMLAMFEDFWFSYPRKIGKQAALKVWKRLKPDQELTSHIIKALETAKTTDQWQREEGRFIPHASTWLNGQRWEDLHVVEVKEKNPFAFLDDIPMSAEEKRLDDEYKREKGLL